jgi:hypothetical protein
MLLGNIPEDGMFVPKWGTEYLYTSTISTQHDAKNAINNI